ncbi:ectonucleoside triphosphate diphosphohydrolase 6 isoform X1 [Xiphophorus couchianus]|uniref:nucleoside diphosphate phosphatase n=1 Tax=Xiphophorus couchianus TaxID=32473 RepID=A0A3B5L3F0_9TELE|nr:ectonucleoside triphosphate diphosphohydrolase 6 isoform X1 [Xiphophorus couchianus]XP_027862872.1 ectonucleoside triphosphate diphosphohydrolase 6 isoform X1 [Xiphophorus couchianus]
MRFKMAALFLLLVLVLVLVLFLQRFSSSSSYRPPPHRPASHRTEPDWPGSSEGDGFQYEVMFDAGSTGTRVHVFRFQMGNPGSPSLDRETFRAIEPGLSTYADDPQKCSAGIVALLDLARSVVPPSQWTRTPVVLKATAGLRLLPGDRAEQLLDRVRALFQDSPFLSTEDSVSIMDGTDEGISAWITINFLTGGLQGLDRPTVGMLDLGGGSTQITFSPRHEKTIQTSAIDDIRSFQMFNRAHTVYTHSYLGLGLMSARLAVLGGVDVSPSGGSTERVSPCLAPEFSGSWEHADVIYTLKGQKEGEPVYEACLNKIQKVLYRKLSAAPEAADVDFYAFSFYYDRAVDLQAIDEAAGGTIRVSDYGQAAERVCRGPPDLQNPFLCLDLVYISVLLQELGFPAHKQLRLARTVRQVEASWALGAAFQHLEALRRH